MTPDFKKLAELNAELRRQRAAGTLTEASFQALLDGALIAVGDHPEFLEGILMRGREFGVHT